ncbi:hypothetical protein Tco_0193870 [Tanacetum coccineum]
MTFQSNCHQPGENSKELEAQGDIKFGTDVGHYTHELSVSKKERRGQRTWQDAKKPKEATLLFEAALR